MSHLGDLLSALVDGELSGAELDRANAHLAACARCQEEGARLRDLKRELRGFGDVDRPDELTRRLLAMAAPGPPGQRPRPRPGRGRRRRAAAGRRPGPPQRAGQRPRMAGRPRHRRGRYMLWSAVSLVVVGIGAAAFGMGGSAGGNGRQITPRQLEVFEIQHAITAGEVPFADPSKTPAPSPSGAATETAKP